MEQQTEVLKELLPQLPLPKNNCKHVLRLLWWRLTELLIPDDAAFVYSCAR